MGFPGGSIVKKLPANAGDMDLILGWEDTLEKEMANHSSILAWKIPWTEETGRLQSTWPQRARHDSQNNPSIPDGPVVKNPPANAGNVGSVPGWGRSPGEGNGNPL